MITSAFESIPNPFSEVSNFNLYCDLISYHYAHMVVCWYEEYYLYFEPNNEK